MSWRIGRVTLDPIDIAAIILRKMRRNVEAETGSSLDRAIVTHPRDFGLARKEATAIAARVAGIDLLGTINEPEAAAYMLFRPGERREPGIRLVFDFGGGTLDVAVLKIPKRGRPEVIGGYGDPQLGGKDFDAVAYEILLEQAAQSIDARYEPRQLELELSLESQLSGHEHAVRWKESVSARAEFQKREEVHFEDGRRHVVVWRGSRELFLTRTKSLVQKCIHAVDAALQNAGLSDSAISSVVLCGGSSRLVTVQEALRTRFGASKVPDPLTEYGMDVDFAVSQGAARWAGHVVLNGGADGEKVRQDAPVSTLVHGVNLRLLSRDREVLEPLIRQGTTLPTSVPRSFSIAVAGSDLEIELFEGAPGPWAPELLPSGRVLLKGVDAKVGDKVQLDIEVASSGLISVHAKHERTGRAIKTTLEVQGSLPGDDTLRDRQRRHEDIEVV